MSTERGEGRGGPRHSSGPEGPDDPSDPYAPVWWTPEPREPAPELAVPEPTGPVPVAPSARAQLVPSSDLTGVPMPRDAPDDAARRRRRAEETVRALQRSENRLTDQIRAARAAGRTDGMRELLSRRLAVRARLEEARARV